jgi:hypothetical protein
MVGATNRLPGDSGAAYVFDITPPSGCAADINDDGVADSRDVLAFLNAWSGGDNEADWNGDGVVNTQDVLAFLNDWTAC